MFAVKSNTLLQRIFFAMTLIALASAATLSCATANPSAREEQPRNAMVRSTPAPGATVTYRKVFKTSFPEFVEIKLDQSGSGTWDIRQLDEDATPQAFQVSPALAQRIFTLAGNLHNFRGVDLDVHRRLANLGEKTFTYTSGAETHTTTFNYTLDQSATQLVNLFEGLARQTTDLADLARTMRYDHLGVNDVMKQIEDDYNTKQLPEPELLLPTLDQLAGDEKFVDIARQRARNLAAKIRGAQ
jgi:hypothetical protein